MSARAKRPTDSDATVPERPAVREPAHDPSDEAKTAIFDSGKFTKPSNLTGPMQMISMKTPGDDRIAADQMSAQPLKRPNLRAMSEMQPQPQQSLGFLAPPVDRFQRRKRAMRDAVMIVSLSIIIASVIALAIWFLAG